MGEAGSLGADFARALASKNSERIRELMQPDVEFRALTPKRAWEANGPEEVLSIVFGHWFEDSDEILALEALETDSFADRERVGYRLSLRNPEGEFLLEQQAYISDRDGRIGWMRVLCSGYRPVASRA
jgi:hypothetical protein